MVFSSAVFVFGFMPLLLFLYFLAEPKYRNYILLIFSLIFYCLGGVNYLLLMLSGVRSVYVFAFVIAQIKTQKIRKLFVVLSVVVNLGVLGYYKYTNFFIENINHFIKNDIKIATIVLPIGISFFTFQAMSYVIDVYRGDVAAQKNPFYVMLYVSLFPQLVAGPIVRYKTVENEIAHRQIHMEDVADGLERFILGFAKKIIIANNVGALADKIFEMNSIDMPLAWLGAIAYTLQIYFDFSAYSDMAIGIALLLGFRFNINFDSPYQSATITEFWRRWHISLSSWLKDYLYISLGGNRKGKIRTYMNLMITMLLGGLWHGASISFILWGALHGIALAAHKFIMGHFSSFKALGCEMKPWRRVLGVLITFHVVCFGWILFRATSMKAVGEMLRQIFTNFHPEVFMQFVSGYKGVFALMVIGYVLHFMPKRSEDVLREIVTRSPLLIQAAILAIAIFIVVQFKSAGVQPFIYFQF